MAIGGALGGIYGAGGGFVIGFLTGLFTAEIYDDQLNTQIQSEQTKDKLLEAKIEQELERQRQLEAQLLNSPATPQENHAGLPPSSTAGPLDPTASSVATNDGSSTVASLSKKRISFKPNDRPPHLRMSRSGTSTATAFRTYGFTTARLGPARSCAKRRPATSMAELTPGVISKTDG